MSVFLKKQREMRAARLQGGSDNLSLHGRPLSRMPQGLMAANQQAKLLESALNEDLEQLAKTASLERRGQIKRDALLPKYREHVDALMKMGRKHPLISYYLVWCFDAGDIPAGLKIADWALENGLELPERFKASLQFFVASNLLAWARGEQTAGRAFEPYVSETLSRVELEAWDIADSCTAGFYALLGRAALEKGDYAEAAAKLARAQELGVKVRTDLEKARKRLCHQNNQTQPQDGAAPQEA